MTYNEHDIIERIKKLKHSFLLKFFCSTLIIAIACTVIAFFPEKTVTFICALIIIAASVFIIRTLKRYRPRILFSKETEGVNIKEHEFVITNKRLTFSARRSFPRLKVKRNNSDKSRTKPPTSAIVYLKLKDGDVTFIDGLSGVQTDVYEIGDTLYKYRGTKYPIIVGREVKSQPCPLCGTVNKSSESRCITCGLGIHQ